MPPALRCKGVDDSESETSANGRRDFLRTVLVAPDLAAALVDTAHAEAAQRDVFVKHAYQEHTVRPSLHR